MKGDEFEQRGLAQSGTPNKRARPHDAVRVPVLLVGFSPSFSLTKLNSIQFYWHVH